MERQHTRVDDTTRLEQVQAQPGSSFTGWPPLPPRVPPPLVLPPGLLTALPLLPVSNRLCVSCVPCINPNVRTAYDSSSFEPTAA